MSTPTPATVVPLPTRGAFDWPALHAYLRGRAIDAIEQVEEARYVRAATVGHGTAIVEVRPVGTHDAELVIHDAPPGLTDALTVLACRALSLHAPDAHDAARRALGADPDLAPLLATRPNLRVPGTWDPFETGVRAIVGQQVSVAGATTITGRIVERHGTPITSSVGTRLAPLRLTRRFPRPEALAEGDLTGLGLTSARMATIRAFAVGVADGEIRLDDRVPLDELVASITARRGLGPWTAHYLALRLGHHDAFPSADLALRRALDPDDPPTARSLERRAEAWRPWRALAATHLWAADAAHRRAGSAAVP